MKLSSDGDACSAAQKEAGDWPSDVSSVCRGLKYWNGFSAM